MHRIVDVDVGAGARWSLPHFLVVEARIGGVKWHLDHVLEQDFVLDGLGLVLLVVVLAWADDGCECLPSVRRSLVVHPALAA